MKPRKLAAAIVAGIALLGAAPAQAYDCSAATYYEDYWTNTWDHGRTDFWLVPDLPNGGSITLTNGYTTFDWYPNGWQILTWAPEEVNHSQITITFSCQNGVFTGGAGWGYWG